MSNVKLIIKELSITAGRLSMFMTCCRKKNPKKTQKYQNNTNILRTNYVHKLLFINCFNTVV